MCQILGVQGHKTHSLLAAYMENNQNYFIKNRHIEHRNEWKSKHCFVI